MNQPLARIGQRFTAQFIDGLMAMALAFALYQVAKVLGLSNAWAFTGWLVYALLCDGLPGGQSVGKGLVKIRAVHVETEHPCSYLQSFFRNLTLCLGVLDVVFIAGKQRRRLGDLLARTKVVQV